MTLSAIEWTTRSDWNPFRGCTRVSPGCGGPGPQGGCYAERIAGRFSDPGQPFHTFAQRTPAGARWTGKVELVEDRLTLPLHWRRPAPGQNRCFPTSMSDPFHEAISDDDLDRFFAVVIMAQDWTFQLLTKRTARMQRYFSQHRWHRWAAAGREIDPARWAGLRRIIGADCTPIPNLWLGTSVEDQPRADERVPALLNTPAAVRWLSCEPLLGELDLSRVYPTEDEHGIYLHDAPISSLDWIVVGGESGPGARDNDFLANARSLRDQCRAAGVPFFGKQGFRKQPLPDDLLVREFPA